MNIPVKNDSILYLRETLQIVEEIDRFFPDPGSAPIMKLGHAALRYLLDASPSVERSAALLAELENARSEALKARDGLVTYSWSRVIDLCLVAVRERSTEVAS